jgi:hypothetical protein
LFRGKSYTWNKKWINHFESPWSIFEKFKYANVVGSSDVLTIFTRDGCKSLKKIFWTNLDRDLLMLANIDDAKSKSILGLSLHENNKIMIVKILSPYFNVDFDNHHYFRDNLTFCMECIQLGFHSLFHQFRLVNQCPFHLIPLHHVCPKCKRTYQYALTDRNWSHAFCCKCGFKYLNSSNVSFTELWKWKDLEITDQDLRYWLSCRERFEYFIDLRSISRNKSVRQNLLSRPYDIGNKYVISYKKQNPIISKYRKDEHNSELECEIVKTMRSVQKAIVRHIRRHVISKHKSCVFRLVRGFPDETTCPFAYAYVLWRQKIDNFKQYWQVDNSDLYRYQLESFSIENHLLSTNLASLLSKVELAFHCYSPSLYFWIINWYYGDNLLQSFKNYLSAGPIYTKECLLVNFPRDYTETVPNITIKELKVNSTLKKIELTKCSHNQPSISDLVKQLACPFLQR